MNPIDQKVFPRTNYLPIYTELVEGRRDSSAFEYQAVAQVEERGSTPSTKTLRFRF